MFKHYNEFKEHTHKLLNEIRKTMLHMAEELNKGLKILKELN
jgi:hypothetical protein